MKFKRLHIHGWRQYAEVNIRFHPQVTIIAGANGAGKSTLLRILSMNFGVGYSMVATPTLLKSGVVRYISGLLARGRTDESEQMHNVGSLHYWDENHTSLEVPASGPSTYQVSLPHMRSVDGLFIGSHRSLSTYQAVNSIPTNAMDAERAYQVYHQEVQNRYNNSFTQFSPTYRMKEALISMATFGIGNPNVQGNEKLAANYRDFKEILKKILPQSIGFRDISVRIPDVVLVTTTGDFSLDASSGGLMALIDLAWQIFLYSRERSEFSVVIDEPENHLHPSMQRILLGNLVSAFPGAQFIVATHSPFVVSSVRNSSVFVLRYDEEIEESSSRQRVVSEQLDNVNKSGTAAEILRTVLGVPVTLPLWAESELETLTEDIELESLDRQGIDSLREKLRLAGLAEYYPDALRIMARRR